MKVFIMERLLAAVEVEKAVCWGELPYFLEAADARLGFLETTCASLISSWMTRWMEVR